MKLEGKAAIVTGGSRGIGHAIARRYLSEGADVVITGREPHALDAARDRLADVGPGTVVAVRADVRGAAAANEVVEAALGHFGKIDVLVNNAGTVVVGPTIDVSEEDWDLMVDTNLKGPFLMCQAAARAMLPRREGAIINIGSIAGFLGMPRRAVYCATKGGIDQLTRALAVEWAPLGIRVNCLAPGYVRTEGHDRLVEKRVIDRDRLAAATPAGRVAHVDEIAGPAVFLASDDARFIHGAILLADGGWVADGHVPSVPDA